MTNSRVLSRLLPVLLGGVLLGLFAALPPAAFAGCKEEIASAEESLIVVTKRLDTVREVNRARAQSLLDDAKRLIGEAKEQCTDKQTTMERAGSASKALLAQGNISTAALLIKAD